MIRFFWVDFSGLIFNIIRTRQLFACRGSLLFPHPGSRLFPHPFGMGAFEFVRTNLLHSFSPVKSELEIGETFFYDLTHL